MALKFLIFFLLPGFAGAVYAAAEAPLLQLTLQPNFEKEVSCSWRGKSNVKFWVGVVEDARAGEAGFVSARPLPLVFQGLLEEGLKRCGGRLTGDKEVAHIWVSGNIDDFSGASKKGLLKGKATGRLEFTLNLKRPDVNDHLSLSFELEETHMKGISKKPKKLEMVLNNLLTRLALDIFSSERLAVWLQ